MPVFPPAGGLYKYVDLEEYPVSAIPHATLRFPHAPDAEPNTLDVATFVTALAEDHDEDDRYDREMVDMLARYQQQAAAGEAEADQWEDAFRDQFPADTWRVAGPPENFPDQAAEQWRVFSRSLTFEQRSRLAFALFVTPVIEATLDRFGIAALRNPRLQVDPFAGGRFDLAAHVGQLLDALDSRIAVDPYPEQVRNDRSMKRLLLRFARRCKLPLNRGPHRPHHPRP